MVCRQKTTSMRIYGINIKLYLFLPIQWLEDDFLKWLDEWEQQVKSKKDLKSKERNKLILSKETLIGIRITGETIYMQCKLITVTIILL